jgi:hypothetical protein
MQSYILVTINLHTQCAFSPIHFCFLHDNAVHLLHLPSGAPSSLMLNHTCYARIKHIPRKCCRTPICFPSFQTPMRTQTSHVKSSKYKQSNHTLMHSSSRPNASAQQPPLTTEEPTRPRHRLRAGVGELVPRRPLGRRGGFNRGRSGNRLFSTAEIGACGSCAVGRGGACCG